MPSQAAKRDFVDFFKPYARSPAQTIPQKRPSPSASEDQDTITVGHSQPRVTKTPTKTVSFKDVTPTPRPLKETLLSPLSSSSLPIRSPRTLGSCSPDHNRRHTRSRSQSTLEGASQAQSTYHEISFTLSDISDRSVKQNGTVVAIRDSDDDTDSLESLQDIFGRKTEKCSTDTDATSTQDAESLEVERRTVLNLFTHERSNPIIGKEKLRALRAKENGMKGSLAGVLDDHFADEESELKIARMRMEMEENHDPANTTNEIDEHILAALVRSGDSEDKDDDIGRLLGAVQRTEALFGVKVYNFFGNSTGRSGNKDVDFSSRATPRGSRLSNYNGSQRRAFLSGIVTEMAVIDDLLSEDHYVWMLNGLIESRDALLRYNCQHTIQTASKKWTRLNLTPANVQTIFRRLGAKEEAIRDGTAIEPRHQPSHRLSSLQVEQIISAMEFFTSVCIDMDMASLSKLCSCVLRLSLDVASTLNARISQAIEQLLVAMLNIPDTDTLEHVCDRFVSDVSQHLHDPALQAQLIARIPAMSPAACRLRKTLADIFLLSSLSTNTGVEGRATPLTLDQLAKHVSASHLFSLTRHASKPLDYAALTSVSLILDASIGSGYPILQADANRDEVKAFNSSVDHLADRLHTIFTSIKDTGASHMRRTEAKDALQAVHFRLLYSVRRGVRKKRHVFDLTAQGKRISLDGAVWRENERKSEFMQRFLERGPTTNTTAL